MRGYDPAFKANLAREMRRARFDLKIAAGTGTKLSTMQRRIRLPNGATMEGFDLYAVDVDREGRECGMPVLLNDVPLSCVEEAAEYADSVARGRQWFTWRGARAGLIGADSRLPPRIVQVEERASPKLTRRP